ncbi:hypothetical protein DSM104440_03095 [Usitatibacter palustris]|uniref:Heavy-metal resistance n=2 Tax=Usitatibacter palustris TaxID=2732487 RepID=A0A6M4H9N2_9PROT|nr:hypothetical protein DSM104440_03095 [Usitatibacter palustris]
MHKNPKMFRTVALGCMLLGAATFASAQDVDGKLAAYKAASGEAVAVMTKVTDANSAKANQAALDAAMNKQRAAEAALTAETKKLNLKDKAGTDKMQAVMTELTTQNQVITAHQLRILSSKETGEVVGKSFMAPTQQR